MQFFLISLLIGAKPLVDNSKMTKDFSPTILFKLFNLGGFVGKMWVLRGGIPFTKRRGGGTHGRPCF